MNLGKFFFRHRGVTPYPIVLLFAFFAEPTLFSFAIGLLIIAGGEAIRIWSVAYIGPDSRKLDVQVHQLITAGPYAQVRNPIYIGNILLYTGATLIANFWMPYLLVFVWFYFGFQYYNIIHLEEQALEKAFGDEFREYCQKVPSVLPNFSAGLDRFQQPDYPAALKSERSTFISIAGILLLLVLRTIF